MLKVFCRTLVAIAACGLAALSTSALAGRVILVDVGDQYEFDGQLWTPNPPGEASYAPGANTGLIPFALNFGDGLGTTHHFAFDPAGGLQISDGTGSFGPGYFIAPLLAATPYSLADPSNPFGSFMHWGAGKVDPALLDNLPNPATYDINNALDAYRFTWLGVCHTCTGADTVSFQVLLIDRKNGDFDLDFAYGPGTSTGQFGYRLASNTLALASTSFNGVGPDYCFRDGVGALCGTVAAVPEPATMTLMLSGLALLGVSARRRRSSQRSR
jgi:hypothetical protein